MNEPGQSKFNITFNDVYNPDFNKILRNTAGHLYFRDPDPYFVSLIPLLKD
jgi:hypothetical protein